MAQARVMHYLNQFFAGMGAEDKAEMPPGFRDEVLGPGKRLQDLLGSSASIVVTAYCGDNYFAENTDQALKSILQIARDHEVEIVVAGPAFTAGRYGFGCSEVCHFLSTSAGLHCVTGMFVENPGVETYRQYKDRRVFLLPTSEDIIGMEDALSRMAHLALKLASGSAIGLPSEEGYIPRGIRLDEVAVKDGGERAVDMLLDKLGGRPFTTEIPIEKFEEIPIAAPLVKLKDAQLALVSTSGVTLAGNPFGFKVFRNTQWKKYSIDQLDSMKDAKWDVFHAGYSNAYMVANPNYGVPLDACRQLEREGAFGKLYPYFYGTTGVWGAILVFQAMGSEMAADLKAKNVDGVILVST